MKAESQVSGNPKNSKRQFDMILVSDNSSYSPYHIKLEEELEDFVYAHSKSLFQDESFFLDKQKIGSKIGTNVIPDAFAISLGSQPAWYIVEVEMVTHDPYLHIIPQIMKFGASAKNPNTRRALVSAFEKELLSTPSIASKLQERNVFKFLTVLFETDPIILVVIDKKEEKLTEALEESLSKYKIISLEFQSFANFQVIPKFLHLVEQVPSSGQPVSSQQISRTTWKSPLRKEFLYKVSAEMIQRFPELKESYNNKEDPSYSQLRFGHPSFHLETHVRKGEITVSLDVEFSGKDARKLKDEFFEYLTKHKDRYSSIDNLHVLKDWVNDGDWGRIFVSIGFTSLDSDTLAKVVSILSQIYNALKPLIIEFEKISSSGNNKSVDF